MRRPLLALGLAGCAMLAMPAAGQDRPLLAPERLDSLPAADRAEWQQYLERSRQLAEADRGVLATELRALGRERPTPAPEGPNHVLGDEMTPAWFRTPAARRAALHLVSYQTPSGGWSKRVDFVGRGREPGGAYGTGSGWSFAPTFDNDATTEHLRFLDAVHAAQPDARWRESFAQGLELVLGAQFPNGCWPQSFPLGGSYHDAATFNDDVSARVLRLLRDVAAGALPIAGDPQRRRAAAAVERGLGCILASQVIVDGRRTVWGAQHDPLTLRPVAARAYEHASLSGAESTALVELLLDLPDPSPAAVEAVHAAADWFRATAIRGFAYERRNELVARPGAGPIWARFYEIGTNRPIFSNRDGVVRYDWSELQPERRYGYAWYGEWPARTLRRYEGWAARFPRAAVAG